ncbi:unnamed protein product, partial [Mesorhabditis spiculigera]
MREIWLLPAILVCCLHAEKRSLLMGSHILHPFDLFKPPNQNATSSVPEPTTQSAQLADSNTTAVDNVMSLDWSIEGGDLWNLRILEVHCPTLNDTLGFHVNLYRNDTLVAETNCRELQDNLTTGGPLIWKGYTRILLTRDGATPDDSSSLVVEHRFPGTRKICVPVDGSVSLDFHGNRHGQRWVISPGTKHCQKRDLATLLVSIHMHGDQNCNTYEMRIWDMFSDGEAFVVRPNNAPREDSLLHIEANHSHYLVPTFGRTLVEFVAQCAANESISGIHDSLHASVSYGTRMVAADRLSLELSHAEYGVQRQNQGPWELTIKVGPPALLTVLASDGDTTDVRRRSLYFVYNKGGSCHHQVVHPLNASCGFVVKETTVVIRYDSPYYVYSRKPTAKLGFQINVQPIDAERIAQQHGNECMYDNWIEGVPFTRGRAETFAGAPIETVARTTLVTWIFIPLVYLSLAGTAIYACLYVDHHLDSPH